MLKLLKYFDFVWSRRKTKYGFLLIFLGVLTPLHTVLLLTSIGLSTEIIILGITLLFGWILWLFHSGRRSFNSDKITIAFSMRSLSPSAQQVISMTNAMIQERFKHLDILELFNLKDIGTDIISTIGQANDFINRRKYNMIIHGTVFNGRADGRYIYNLNNFMFTYRIFNPPDAARLVLAMQRDIELFASHRDWLIKESNDIIDTEKVSNNLVEIILATIAICLARSADHFPLAIKIIETLLPEIERKAKEQGQSVKIDTKQKRISIPIDLLRSGRLRNILGNIYVVYSRILTEREEYTTAIKQAEKGLHAGANPIDAHASIALAKYHLGNLKDSEHHVDEIGKIDSHHPLYLVDKAFFSILHEQYSNVVDLYGELPDLIVDNDPMIYQVITFLSVRFKTHPNEIAYLFAIGFIYYHFIDKIQGCRELKRFKKEARNQKKYGVMYRVATRLI